jgi:tetratricopeptide (TPR) repeat protein
MRYSYVADHFQYLASPALIAAIVALLANVMGKPSGDATSEPSPAPYVLSAIVLVVLSVMTFVRAEVFMGNIPLWRDVIAKNPDSWIAHYNLGTELMFDAATPGGRDPKELAQQLDEATKHFQGTIRLKPDHDKAYNHWGHVLYLQGNIDAAVDKFNQALSINPNNWAAMVNLAQARMQKKQYADAEKLLHQAITLTSEKKAGASNGEKSDMHRFLAATLLALGHKDEALAEYQQALEIFPLNYSARMDYGKLLRAQGKLTEAATQFVRVLREAQLVDALVQIAELQTEVGKLEPAREHLELAVRLNPNAPGLREAVEAWRRKSDAATKPSTTRSTTTRSTTTRAASIPATVPAIRP